MHRALVQTDALQANDCSQLSLEKVVQWLATSPSLHYGQPEIQQEIEEARLMHYQQMLICQRLHTELVAGSSERLLPFRIDSKGVRHQPRCPTRLPRQDLAVKKHSNQKECPLS